MNSKNIIFESTYENIKEFIKDKKTFDLVNLYMYIMSTESMERPPSKVEREFITEFFSDEAWADFIQYRKREQEGKKSYFKHIPPFDLHTISGILSFEIMKLVEKEFSASKRLKAQQNKNKKLKKDLENALDNSYYDSIFDKVDGFSNLYETLISHKLLKERED